jgi:hypothetical protein
LAVVDGILRRLGSHVRSKVLLVSQHVAIVCFSLVKLVHPQEQLLMLLEVLGVQLRRMRPGMGRANRC